MRNRVQTLDPGGEWTDLGRKVTAADVRNQRVDKRLARDGKLICDSCGNEGEVADFEAAGPEEIVCLDCLYAYYPLLAAKFEAED